MSKRKSIKNLELSGLGNLIKNIRSMRMRRQNHGNRKSRKKGVAIYGKFRRFMVLCGRDSPEAARPIYALLYVLGLFHAAGQ